MMITYSQDEAFYQEKICYQGDVRRQSSMSADPAERLEMSEPLEVGDVSDVIEHEQGEERSFLGARV